MKSSSSIKAKKKAGMVSEQATLGRMLMSQLRLVLAALADRGTPNSYVHENRYFMGQGNNGTKVLSAENRIKAIAMLAHDMELTAANVDKILVNQIAQTDTVVKLKKPRKKPQAWNPTL